MNASVELGSTWPTARYTQCPTQLYQVVLSIPAGHPLKALVCLSSSTRRSCWWRIASSRNALVEPVGPPQQPPTAPSETRQLWWKKIPGDTRYYRACRRSLTDCCGLAALVLTRTSRPYPARLCQRPATLGLSLQRSGKRGALRCIYCSLHNVADVYLLERRRNVDAITSHSRFLSTWTIRQNCHCCVGPFEKHTEEGVSMAHVRAVVELRTQHLDPYAYASTLPDENVASKQREKLAPSCDLLRHEPSVSPESSQTTVCSLLAAIAAVCIH